jgi:hypothetical protein
MRRTAGGTRIDGRPNPGEEGVKHKGMVGALLVVGVGVVLGVTVFRSDSAEAAKARERATDPLVGTWDTGPIPVQKLRAALRSAGYTNANVTKMFHEFGIVKAQEFRLRFYRQGGAPFQLGNGWDPSQQQPGPNDGDHGPYKLLPNHRFVVSGVDPPTDKNRAVFSYSVTGKILRLRLVSLSEPAFSAAEVAFDRMAHRAQVAFPFRKIY